MGRADGGVGAGEKRVSWEGGAGGAAAGGAAEAGRAGDEAWKGRALPEAPAGRRGARGQRRAGFAVRGGEGGGGVGRAAVAAGASAAVGNLGRGAKGGAGGLWCCAEREGGIGRDAVGRRGANSVLVGTHEYNRYSFAPGGTDALVQVGGGEGGAVVVLSVGDDEKNGDDLWLEVADLARESAVKAGKAALEGVQPLHKSIDQAREAAGGDHLRQGVGRRRKPRTQVDRVNGSFSGIVKSRQCKQCLGFIAPCQFLVLRYKVHHAGCWDGSEGAHRSGTVNDGFDNNKRRWDVRTRAVWSTFDVGKAGKGNHLWVCKVGCE